MTAYLGETFRAMADFLFARDVPGREITRSHSWPLAPSLTVAILLAAAALVIWLYLRERGPAGRFVRAAMAALRLLLVTLVLFMMYGWMLHRHRTDLPDLVVLIDDSASMATEDRVEQEAAAAALKKRLAAAGIAGGTRLDLARLALLGGKRPLLAELQHRYRLKVYRMAGSARVLAESEDSLGGQRATLEESIRNLAAVEPASRLGESVTDVLGLQRGRPTAALLLLTDGVTTEGQTIAEAAAAARRRSVPLYIVGVGDPHPPRDVRLEDLLVDEVAFVGDLVNFDGKVTAVGYEGTQAVVRLFRSGSSAGPLDEQTLTLGRDGVPQSVRLSFRPAEQGDFDYTVEVAPREGEATAENNRATARLRVREEILRVLFVQAYPSYEFRYLKNMLGRRLQRDKQEKAVQLTTVLQEADLEYAEQDETASRVFPVSRDELFAYDAIVFGDVNPASLSRSVMENIVAFVEERGGGVVFLAGPRFTPLAYRDTPLAPLLPIDPETAIGPLPGEPLSQGFRAQPTRLGTLSPHLQLEDRLADTMQAWRQLPPLYWLLEARDLRPAARVLLEVPSRTLPGGEPAPLVCQQFYGLGKVVFHATDETYRWSRSPAGEQHYARYWLQTLRYLSRARLLEGSRQAELETDRAEYRRGDPVRVRVRFFDDRLAPVRDDGVTAVVDQEGSRRRQLTLHRDSASRAVYEGTISDLPDGRYRAWLAAPTLEGQPPAQRFDVVAPPGEQARLQMDQADLTKASRLTQGAFYSLDTAGNLLRDLPEGRQVRLESLPPEPVWNSPLLAAMFVAAIVLEWLLRNRAGML